MRTGSIRLGSMGSKHPVAVARKARGLSQEALGRLIGVSRDAVKNWENGTRFPSEKCLNALRETLAFSEDDLWRIRHFRPRKAVRLPERSALW